jgi:two-component system, NtrC family, sensor kinase
VLRDTTSLVEHQFQKTGVRMEIDLAEELPSIRGNSGKLQQVFLNLMINARDAMPEGGVLKLRSRAEAGFAVIEVADNGQGIPPEHLARIYDPFFTTKGPRKGTGLGLSISYGIVHEHDGLIDVDSTVGGGTRFRLEFPGLAARRARLLSNTAEALSA